MNNQKKCIHCDRMIDFENLVYHKGRKDDRENVCKKCARNMKITGSETYKTRLKRKREEYKNSKEYRDKMKQKSAQYRHDNVKKIMLGQAKTRANRDGKDFNITIDDIIIPKFCPILNIRLEKNVGVKSQNSPSLDRIDNSKGYIKGNIRVISYLANHMKADATEEQLLLFSKNIINYLHGDDIV